MKERNYFQPNGGELFKYFTSLPCWHLSPVEEGVHWQVLSFRHWPPFSHGGLHNAEKRNYYLRKWPRVCRFLE
jgi:hypothetical protein